MNKIDFDSFFDEEKKKKKEIKKQVKVEKRIQNKIPIKINNKSIKSEDIRDLGYESKGLENKLELDKFDNEQKETKISINIENELSSDNKDAKRRKTFLCTHPDCSVEFAYEQHLKEHILNTHNKLKASTKKIIEVSSINKVKPKIYHCSYKNCNRKFSLETALNQHIEDKHMKSKLIEKKKKVTKTFTVTKKIDDIDFLKERIISINTTLSITVDRIIHNEILEDIDNVRVLSFTNISDSQKSMYHMIKEYYGKLLVIEKNNSSLKELLNIQCEYCLDFFYNKNSLLTHVQSEHKESLAKFLKKNNIKKSHCKYCDELIVSNFFQKHYKKCSKIKCEYCDESMNKDKYPQHIQKCLQYKKTIWEKNSSIKEIVEEKETLTNIEKHQAKVYQFREDEELDPDLIDEEEYQKTFGTQLYNKSQQIRARVAFEHEKIYKQEEEDKSEIKIFLSKMYKGYCQVCGYTFRKTNGVNSFERFNWNDKRVVKVKKSLVSTADSLCLCRNCSANIKWGAFYPNFVDTIREIEEFKSKSYDEIREKLHKVVDENIPKIFDFHLHEDIYALEIELDGKPRNIYFTNEHLLQFITYLQKEDEVEEEVKVKRKIRMEKDIINNIYNSNSWLKREETIPLELAESFIRATAEWNHPTAHRYVPAPKHADNIYNNSQYGWAVDFGSNSFLVGKAIERCKNAINEYIENQRDRSLSELKERLAKHISGAVATGNNYEYSGCYPIEDGYMKFGVQGIDVEDGVNFLIRRLGLEKHLISK